MGGRRIVHGIETVDQEVEQDLLELNRVCFNRRQIWLEQSLHFAGLKHCIRFYHAHHLDHKIVQIHLLPVRDASFHHALDAANHSAGSVCISHDVTEQVV